MSTERDEQMYCVKCKITTDELLVVTCDHNLCLECAARNLVKEEKKNLREYKTVVCEICFAPTSLDNETADVLMSLEIAKEEHKNYGKIKTKSVFV